MPSKPATFRPLGQPTPQQRDRQYDQRRGSARERGYTQRWDVSATVFKCEHPLCLGCEAVGRVEPTTVVDHIIPHKGDDALFWDPINRQPACQWHHDVVKQKLEADYAAGRITAADLRLDSKAAQTLTFSLRG